MSAPKSFAVDFLDRGGGRFAVEAHEALSFRRAGGPFPLSMLTKNYSSSPRRT